MTPAIVKVYSTVASKLSDLPIESGQLIFVKDLRRIFLDMNGLRLGYDTIQIFNSDEERLATLAPVTGFYFVESTGVFWRYNQKWIQISPSNLQPLFFGEYEDFPPEGNSSTLYISNDATYKWNSASRSYIVVANKTEWKQIGV